MALACAEAAAAEAQSPAFDSAYGACVDAGPALSERFDGLVGAGWRSLSDTTAARDRLALYGLLRFPDPVLEGGDRYIGIVEAIREVPYPLSRAGGEPITGAEVLSDIGVGNPQLIYELDHPDFDGQLRVDVAAPANSGVAAVKCSLMSALPIDLDALVALAPIGATVTHGPAQEGAGPLLRTNLSFEGGANPDTVVRLEHIGVGVAPGLQAIKSAVGIETVFNSLLITTLFPVKLVAE